MKILVTEPGIGVQDRTNFLHVRSSFNWTLTRGQRGQSSLPFRIPAGSSYAPQIGWPVNIIDTVSGVDKRVFAGTIFSNQINWNMGQDGWRLNQLSLVTLEEMFDNIPCPESEFTNTDAGTIFATLFFFATGLPVAVTLGTVDPGASISERKYDAQTSMGQAFAQLATDSAYIWYVDVEDLQVYFHSHSARPAPFTLTETMVKWQTAQFKQSKGDFRNKQIIQLNPNTAPPASASYPGDNSTTQFNLPGAALQLLSASITTSTQATATGTFSGQPNPGDTITIAGQVYTFAATLDNTVANKVLIGASSGATLQNLIDAINRATAAAGIGYSSPTQPNLSATADAPIGLTFKARAIILGDAGNSIAISESTSNFVWSGATLSGGSDGETIPLSVGVAGTGSFDLTYTPGSDVVTLRTAPGTSESLSVLYGGNGTLTVENNTAVGIGIQGNYQIMTARNAATPAAAIQQATAVMNAYSQIPGEFSFATDTPGFYPGRYQTVNLASPISAPAVLNGNWVIQQVQGSWIAGMEGRPEPFGHFRYQVDLINTTEIQTFIDTLKNLINTGPFNASQPVQSGSGTGGGTGFLPTLYSDKALFKDLTVGNDVIDRICLLAPRKSLSPLTYATMEGVIIRGVLRKTISADLVVRFNKYTRGSPSSSMSWTVTIPSATAVGETVDTFIDGHFLDKDTITGDVISSDGTKDVAGIASFRIGYQVVATS